MGFVDGTFRGSNRPRHRQRDYYSGHYHGQGFKYQAIVTPDALISLLVGPHDDHDNDWSIWQSSIVPSKLDELLRSAYRDMLIVSVVETNHMDRTTTGIIG
jgi:hypothetical protein